MFLLWFILPRKIQTEIVFRKEYYEDYQNMKISK